VAGFLIRERKIEHMVLQKKALQHLSFFLQIALILAPIPFHVTKFFVQRNRFLAQGFISLAQSF
jgi:hypothetical protein